jgi:predicted RNase H-like HicB family nuclease
MKLTAHAERTEGVWTIEVPEVKGLFTQAKRLRDVEVMVRDAAALLTGDPEDSFEIEVVPRVPERVQELIRDSEEHARQAKVANALAAKEAREAAKELHNTEGLTVREVGIVLGVSFQRAHQLINESTHVIF